jgi:hypothetical protein
MFYWLRIAMVMHARLRPIVVGALLLACSSNETPKDDAPRSEGAAEADGGPVERTKDSPLGDAPLTHGQPSLEALGKAVVAALEAKDGGALLRLAVHQGEFERRLFGVLVSDPRQRKSGPGPAWKNLSSESLRAMGNALSGHGGKGYEFVSLESTRKEERTGLVLHTKPRLTVKDPGGEVLELPILGEVIEHPASGTFLVLSFGD